MRIATTLLDKLKALFLPSYPPIEVPTPPSPRYDPRVEEAEHRVRAREAELRQLRAQIRWNRIEDHH
jgi:hypothetical protein